MGAGKAVGLPRWSRSGGFRPATRLHGSTPSWGFLLFGKEKARRDEPWGGALKLASSCSISVPTACVTRTSGAYDFIHRPDLSPSAP